MDALALRQAKTQHSPSQRPSLHKAGQSQAAIDLYSRPVAKAKHDLNDIRKYFPPVVKTEVASNGKVSKSGSPAKRSATPNSHHGNNGAAKCQTPGPSPGFKSPADKMTSFPGSRSSGERAPGILLRARKHNHANSAVLPSFDSLFDNEDFPQSLPPMAPRDTDIVRYSLVPKPLNIKMPSPAAETSRSPSQTTSSPSSAGDADTVSLDEQSREAPSFKQTYLSVHSRKSTDECPASPLTALRDPNPKSSHQRQHRPGTLRAKTAPKLSEPYSTDSVIYFLPKISPASDSSVDEQEPLMSTNYRKPVHKASMRDVFKAKRQVVSFENVSSAQIDRRKDAVENRAVTVSPGKQLHSILTVKVCS